MADIKPSERLRDRWKGKEETISNILRLIRDTPGSDWTPCLEGMKYCGEVPPSPLLGDPNGEHTIHGRDLRGIDLRGQDLSGLCLTYADLSWATLDRASLIRADLSHAKLDYASLIEADLSCAKLVSASLISAELVRSTLDDASLRNASLRKTSMGEASARNVLFIDADLGGARLDDGILSGANFSSASLLGTSLQGANLTGAVFDGAVLADIIVNTRTIIWAEEKWPLWRSLIASEVEARIIEGRDYRGTSLSNTHKYAEAAYSFACVQRNYNDFRLAYERAGDGDKASACRYRQMVCGKKWRYRLSSVLGEDRSNRSQCLAKVHRGMRRGMRFMEWAIFDLTCQYGESLWRVVSCSFLTVFLFAALFAGMAPCVVRTAHDDKGTATINAPCSSSSQPAQRSISTDNRYSPKPLAALRVCPRRATPLEALYLSAVTFTTLGPGDISLCHNCDGGFLTLAIAMEAFLGCFFMSVTAGVFVYRVTRIF